MDAKAFHLGERGREGSIAHRPHDHVGGFGHQADEVPEGVVGGRSLRLAGLSFHLGRMDQIGKVDCVLDEEHRDVVATRSKLPSVV